MTKQLVQDINIVAINLITRQLKKQLNQLKGVLEGAVV